MPPFEYRPFVNPYAGSIGDMLMRRGDIEANRVSAVGNAQARAAETRGGAYGNAVGTIGDVVTRGLDAYVREQREAPVRAQEARLRELQLEQVEAAAAERTEATRARRTQTALMPFALKTNDQGVSTFDRDVLTREMTAAGLGDRLPDLFKGLDEADNAALQLRDARMQLSQAAMKGLALSARAAGGSPQALRLAADHAIANQFVTKEEAEQFLSQVGDDAEKAQYVISALLGETPAAPKTREIRVRNADGSESIQIVEDTPGQSFTSAPAAPENIDAALLAAQRAGDRDEVQRLLGLKRQIAARAPEDPMTQRERQLRIQKLELDLQQAAAGPNNEKLAAALPVLDEIETLASRIFTTDAGPVTNIIGAWRTAAASANLDNDVNEYRSLVRGFTPLMARAVGHAGVLTEQDVQRTEMLFGNIGLLGTDNATVARNKIDRVKRIIAGGGSDAEKAALRNEMGWDGSAAPAAGPARGQGAGPAGRPANPFRN